MSTREHRKQAPMSVRMAVLGVSSTRTVETDESGRWMVEQARKEGHHVFCHRVVPDDIEAISRAVSEVIHAEHPQVVVVAGGTGVSPKDVTIEALRPMMTKELTAFAALFALLSFEQIDSAAILSRAAAGIIDGTAVFCLPGSLSACKLACSELIFPEMGHLVRHLQE